MHFHRLQYIILGLLIYMRNVVCWTCGSEFEDIASRAYMANIIFEGSLIGRYGHDEASNRQTFNAYFLVKRVLKGELPKEADSKEYMPVIAGDFGPEDKARCIADIKLGTNQTYIVFLRNSQNPTVPLYRISAFPEVSSKNVLRKIRRILCDNCAKPPQVSLAGPATLEVEAGKRLQLKCKTKGNPPPQVTWFKDDVQIFMGDGVTIRTNNGQESEDGQIGRGSRLRISKASNIDNGVYKCAARNLKGHAVQQATVVITGRQPGEEDHEELCSQQTYCLNGGTCFYLSALGSMFCRCSEEFMGERCQFRNLYDVLDQIKEQDDLRFDRNMTLAGIIMSVMLLAALCISAYCLARQRKIDFEKRKADKEKYKNQLAEANAKAIEAQKMAPPELPAVPSDGILRKQKDPVFKPVLEERKKETRSVITQTDDLDLEIEAYLASTQSSQNNNMVATSGYSSASPDQSSLCQRTRLPGMSSTTELSQDHHRDMHDGLDSSPAIFNQAVVSAVIENDILTRAPPPKRRSLSEAHNGGPPQRNQRHNGNQHGRQYNHAQKPAFTHQDNDNGSRRRPGGPRGRPVRYDPHSGRLPAHGQEELQAQMGSGSESDSSSSSGVEEEQALFESLKANPRISSRNRHTSYQDMRDTSDFWDMYGTVPSWALTGSSRPHYPPYPAFNPYAIDDDVMGHKHREQIYSYPTNRVRKAQSLQERIMMELQDDADATPV